MPMYISLVSLLPVTLVTHLKQRLRKSSAASLQCPGRGGPCALRFTICSICGNTTREGQRLGEVGHGGLPGTGR